MMAQNIMVAGVCGGGGSLPNADRKQTAMKGLGIRYNLQSHSPVTYFL
jgi:hypothetical protein